MPGGQFVVASDEDGNIHPSAHELLPLIPTPWVTSESLGWNRGLLSGSPVRLAPRLGFALSLDDARAVIRGGYGIFLNQWAYSVQTAFARNLPFFFTKQVDVPTDTGVPPYRTADMLTTSATGTVGASIMDHDYAVEYSQTWSGGVQFELTPGTIVDMGYMGTWTLGADNATIRNVPEPGPGSIQARRPIPELSRINAIRFDGKSIYHAFTIKTERRLRSGRRSMSATRSRRRRTMRRAPERQRRRPTFRRTCATSSATRANGRHRVSTTGTSSSPAARTRSRSFGRPMAWAPRSSAGGGPVQF